MSLPKQRSATLGAIRLNSTSIIDPSFGILTGRLSDEASAFDWALVGRGVVHRDGARPRYRLVIGWAVMDPDMLNEIELRHRLDEIARDLGLTINITGIQRESTTAEVVVDFENTSTLPDPILDSDITISLNWGQCDLTISKTVRELISQPP